MSALLSHLWTVICRAVVAFLAALFSCLWAYDFEDMKVEVRTQMILAHLVAILVAYASLTYDKLSALEKLAATQAGITKAVKPAQIEKASSAGQQAGVEQTRVPEGGVAAEPVGPDAKE